MASATGRSFGFFECFSFQTSSQKLEILVPENIALPNTVFLRNQFMQIWSISIQEEGDVWFFNKGWETFVADNSVADGDYLVFSYKSYGVFDFILLDGESKCEKKAPLAPPPIDADYVEAVKEEKNDDETADDTEVDEEEEESSEDEDYHVEFNHSGGKRSRSRSRYKRAVVGDNDAGEGSSIEKIKDVPDHYGADLFKSGRYAQPTNPYFVAKLMTKNCDDLYVPVDVVRDHNLVFPPTLILRDPRGKEWTAKVKIWSDGRIWLSRGWRSLCRWNQVKKDDNCICEFVPHTGSDMVLHITTIVRADERN